MILGLVTNTACQPNKKPVVVEPIAISVTEKVELINSTITYEPSCTDVETLEKIYTVTNTQYPTETKKENHYKQ